MAQLQLALNPSTEKDGVGMRPACAHELSPLFAELSAVIVGYECVFCNQRFETFEAAHPWVNR
jgi:hypothetical protein